MSTSQPQDLWTPPPGLPPMPVAPKIRLDMAKIGAMGAVEQAQVRDALSEWAQLVDANPLLTYEPAGIKHHAAHMSGARVRAIFGGNRAGKSTTATGDNLIQMTPRSLLPEHLAVYKRHDCEREGPFKLRCVVPDMKRTGEVVREVWRRWTPKGLLRNGSWDKAYDKTMDTLRLECGCFMELLSTEMELNKFGGSSRNRVWYDEEPPEPYRTECLLRIADTGGDELFSMTPLEGMTWMYRRIWKNRHLPNVDVFTIGMRDNRHLRSVDVDYVLSQITNEAERLQREFGLFAERGGQVYPNFLTARRAHPTRAQVLGADAHVIGIDPGIRWAGLIWLAFDRDNRAFAFTAVKLENADVGVVAAKIKEVNRAWGLDKRDPTYVIDPSAVNRNLVTGENFEGALNRHGIYCVHGQNDVDAGIEAIQRRLRLVTLTYSERLKQLEDEAVEYAYEDRDDGVVKVVKKNDHILDPLRYGVMHRPWGMESVATEAVYGNDFAQPPPRRQAADSVMGAMS